MKYASLDQLEHRITGRIARVEETPRNQCPYADLSARAEWLAGWDDQDRELMSKYGPVAISPVNWRTGLLRGTSAATQ